MTDMRICTSDEMEIPEEEDNAGLQETSSSVVTSSDSDAGGHCEDSGGSKDVDAGAAAPKEGLESRIRRVFGVHSRSSAVTPPSGV